MIHDGHGHDKGQQYEDIYYLGFNCGIGGTGRTRSLMRRKKRRGGKRKKTKMMPKVSRGLGISI